MDSQKCIKMNNLTIVSIASPNIYWHKVNMQDGEAWLESCIHWLPQWATVAITYSYSYKRLHTVHIAMHCKRLLLHNLTQAYYCYCLSNCHHSVWVMVESPSDVLSYLLLSQITQCLLNSYTRLAQQEPAMFTHKLKFILLLQLQLCMLYNQLASQLYMHAHGLHWLMSTGLLF